MTYYQSELLTSLNRLTKWFNRKDLTDEQIEEWTSRIGNIPNRFLSQIVDQILDASKTMPTPGDVKKLYGEIKRYNPNKFLPTDQEIESCQYCHGEGRIIAWKIMEDFPYEYDLACAYCNNWRRIFPTRPSGAPAYIMPPKLMRMDDLLKSGFVLELSPKQEITPHEYENVEQMAENVGLKYQDQIPF